MKKIREWIHKDEYTWRDYAKLLCIGAILGSVLGLTVISAIEPGVPAHKEHEAKIKAEHNASFEKRPLRAHASDPVDTATKSVTNATNNVASSTDKTGTNVSTNATKAGTIKCDPADAPGGKVPGGAMEDNMIE